MAFGVTSLSGALAVFLFGFCMGLGWALAAWLVGKLR
jgi:hypothetical protein